MRRAPVLLALVLGAAVLATTAPVGAAGPSLGPVVRLRTPGSELPCVGESEPHTVVTRAGTWVGYNDLNGCLYPTGQAGVLRDAQVSSVQLVPASGGPPRYVRFPPNPAGENLFGDPALAPDPSGDGVLFATMYEVAAGWNTLEMFRISPSLRVTRLPSPMTGGANADKEFIASDTGPRSRYRGRVYAIWYESDVDDAVSYDGTVVRAFDGRRWLPPVRLGESYNGADVAVAPNGDVAAVWESLDGVMVAISRDGGVTFDKPRLVITGWRPGRADPACATIATVGVRQRVMRSVGATYDDAGVLHVVATIGHLHPLFVDYTAPESALSPLGIARVVHASTRDGRTWRSAEIGESAAVRFHSTVSQAPGGGVAVGWLEVSGTRHDLYDAYVAFAPRGTARFSAPVRVSAASAAFPQGTEAQLHGPCYGLGDYIGLAPSPRGVVLAWATTEGTTTPYDTDVFVREVRLR